MRSGCLEFAASPGICVACTWGSLDVATGSHMVVCSLKCYSRKVWYKYRCSLLNSLDPISCKGFVCIPYVISVMISRELKYIDCTFPRVILIPDSTNFLLIVFKVFRKTRLLKLPKRRKPLTHFPKKPKLSVCEL